MRDLRSGVLAEFDASEPMASTARRLHADGFSHVLTFSPYPITGLPQELGFGRTRLPLITLIAGLSGAVFAYWLQWYTAVVSYPLNAGARPTHAAPAFVLITFETTVLFAACAGFFSLFFLLGMPRLWHPTSEIEGFERATIDRFWVGVAADDPYFDESRIIPMLEEEHPLRVVHLEAKA